MCTKIAPRVAGVEENGGHMVRRIDIMRGHRIAVKGGFFGSGHYPTRGGLGCILMIKVVYF